MLDRWTVGPTTTKGATSMGTQMETGAKHTPGPWGYVHHKGLDQHLVGGTLENVAIVEDRHGNVEANAHLIAAAPEMLEALEELVTDFGHILQFDGLKYGPASPATLDRMEKARAAIAKAKGE